jgi:hypothetical protein
MFQKGYDKSVEFAQFREKIDPEKKFESIQSRRIGL